MEQEPGDEYTTEVTLRYYQYPVASDACKDGDDDEPHPKKLMGVIALTDGSQRDSFPRRVSTAPTARATEFEIMTPDRPWRFRASSVERRNAWLAAMNTIIYSALANKEKSRRQASAGRPIVNLGRSALVASHRRWYDGKGYSQGATTQVENAMLAGAASAATGAVKAVGMGAVATVCLATQ